MKSIQEQHEAMSKRTEELYRDSFQRGISMYYRDERATPPKQFIRANPDGSEDLVSLDAQTRQYTLIANLLPAGKGHWAYLAHVPVHG